MEVVKEKSGTGIGEFTLEKLLDMSQMKDRANLYARVTVPPGSSVGYHEHHGDEEAYFILSGEGVYDDNHASVRTLKAGDLTWTPDGCGHSIENKGTEDLVFMALVLKS